MIPVVVDLSYGDTGKGTVVDWLCATRKVGTVVRFNGGPQAAHNVVLPGGTHHTYSQFGSGFGQGSDTFLSRFMLVDPYALMTEANALGAASLNYLWIDEDAPVITPYHWVANQMREKQDQHGSCGRGVGECAKYIMDYPGDEIRMSDCLDRDHLLELLVKLADRLSEERGDRVEPKENIFTIAHNLRAVAEQVQLVEGLEYLQQKSKDGLVFEGAQGVLLDEWFGFHPHTTWSTTTYENADWILNQIGEEPYHVGVLRSYATRHGNGPFPTEDPSLNHPEHHNQKGEWQGVWRQGHFDLQTTQYAIEVCGDNVDELFITHMDRWSTESKFCITYEGAQMVPEVVDKFDLEERAKATEFMYTVKPMYWDGWDEGTFCKMVELGTNVPVGMLSHGPTWKDKTKLAKGRLRPE